MSKHWWSGSRRVVPGLAVVLALTTAASGCSSSGQALQEVEERGLLRVGACLTLPPWGFIDGDGEAAGFDIDLANQLGDHLGVPVEVTEVTGAGRVPALQSGQVDVSACTFTITPERQEQIDFSDPVVAAGTSLVSKTGSGISSVDDLAGRTVAVTKGGTAGPIVEEVAPEAQLRYFETVADVFLALRQGQVDAAVEASGTVTAESADEPELTIVVDGDLSDRVYYALGVAKGESELRSEVNAFVAEFHASGADRELYEEWFGSEPTFQFDDLPATVNAD